MIVVRVEMWPHGDHTRARLIGCLWIDNDGTGTEQIGSYNVAASHTGEYLRRNKDVWKEGRVEHFLRRLNPYRLVAAALRAIGEGV